MIGPAFDTADYDLLWPQVLFTRELAALRADPDYADYPGSVEEYERINFLLDEAFLGETPMQDFGAATFRSRHNQYLDQLDEHSPRLREHHESNPYWPREGSAQRRRPFPSGVFSPT